MTKLRIRPLRADDAGFMERMMLFAGFPPDVARYPAAGLYVRHGFEPAGEWSGMLVMRRRTG